MVQGTEDVITLHEESLNLPDVDMFAKENNALNM